MNSDHSSLEKKYRESLKMQEKPLELNNFFNSKMVNLLTEEDSILYPIFKALEDNREIKTTTSDS